MKTIIRCENLSRTFTVPRRGKSLLRVFKNIISPELDVHQALQNVSLEIKKGECIGLVGSNGAGKTTLLKIFAGLLHPTDGAVSVLGYQPFKRHSEFLKQIGMVMGQKSQLWVDLPAQESFDLLAKIYEIPKEKYKQQLEFLTELFEVGPYINNQVRRLSLGQRMRLEVMAALLHSPSLLFLDEPTIGLDVDAKYRMRRFIREFNKQSQTTIVLTSHDMDDIISVCPRLVLIHSGKIYYDGTLEKFQEQSDNKQRVLKFWWKTALDDSSKQALRQHVEANPKILKHEILDEHTEICVGHENVAVCLQEMIAWQTPRDIKIERPELEEALREVFLEKF